MMTDERLDERSFSGRVVQELIDQIKYLRQKLRDLKDRDSDAETIIADMRAQLSAFTEGMPIPSHLHFSANNIEDFGDQHIDVETAKWLRRIAAMKREG